MSNSDFSDQVQCNNNKNGCLPISFKFNMIQQNEEKGIMNAQVWKSPLNTFPVTFANHLAPDVVS